MQADHLYSDFVVQLAQELWRNHKLVNQMTVFVVHEFMTKKRAYSRMFQFTLSVGKYNSILRKATEGNLQANRTEQSPTVADRRRQKS
uniref:Uncharacterized protein n=1 Tax=Romanomermis culicivorax TaxID=13658 RepID=A0A915JB23_ROMCU